MPKNTTSNYDENQIIQRFRSYARQGWWRTPLLFWSPCQHHTKTVDTALQEYDKARDKTLNTFLVILNEKLIADKKTINPKGKLATLWEKATGIIHKNSEKNSLLSKFADIDAINDKIKERNESQPTYHTSYTPTSD